MTYVPTWRRLGLPLWNVVSLVVALTAIVPMAWREPDLWLLMGVAFATSYGVYVVTGERTWQFLPRDESEWLPLIRSLFIQATISTVALTLLLLIAAYPRFEPVATWMAVSPRVITGWAAVVSGYAAGAILWKRTGGLRPCRVPG